MPVIVAFLFVAVLIAVGIALQWIPYGTSFFRTLETRYRHAYIVLLLRDKPEYAGLSRLAEAVRAIDSADILDSLYVVGSPALRTWFARNDAQEYFDDSLDLVEPATRTDTDTRLLIFAGSIRDLPELGRTDALSLLRQISALPTDKHTSALLRWFPRTSSPAISRQEGADAFGYLLAKTI